MNEIYVYHYKLNDTHCCKLMLYDIQLKMKYRANIYKKIVNLKLVIPILEILSLILLPFAQTKLIIDHCR